MLWLYNAGTEKHLPKGWEDSLLTSSASFSLYGNRDSMAGTAAGLRRLLRGWHPKSCLEVARKWRSLNSSVERLTRTFSPHAIYLSSPAAAYGFRNREFPPVAFNCIDSLALSVQSGSVDSGNRVLNHLRRKWFTRMERDLAFGKKVVFYVSQEDADFAQGVIAPGARIAVIPSGADTERFQPGGEADKAPYPLVLFVGTSRYRPSAAAIRTILSDIAPAVWAKVPRTVFRFVGVGNVELSGQYARLGERAQFAGYVRDLGAELKRAWSAIYPITSGSGIKNKVLDANAASLPVVGFEPAFSGLLPGEGGVHCRTALECAGWLCRILEDSRLRKDMGKASRAWAESVSWEARTAQYMKVLYDLAVEPKEEGQEQT